MAFHKIDTKLHESTRSVTGAEGVPGVQDAATRNRLAVAAPLIALVLSFAAALPAEAAVLYSWAETRWAGGTIPFVLDSKHFPAEIGADELSPTVAWSHQADCEEAELPKSSRYVATDTSTAIENACQDIADVLAAMKYWEGYVPGLDFVERETKPSGNHLKISSSRPRRNNPCHANIWGASGLKHVFVLDMPGDGKCDFPMMVHEVGHQLGLRHEQGRQDRNDHIKVFWDHIKTNRRIQFDKGGRDFGPFDFSSAMLYDPWSFAKEKSTKARPAGIVVGSGNSTLTFDATPLFQGVSSDLAPVLPPAEVAIKPKGKDRKEMASLMGQTAALAEADGSGGWSVTVPVSGLAGSWIDPKNWKLSRKGERFDKPVMTRRGMSFPADGRAAIEWYRPGEGASNTDVSAIFRIHPPTVGATAEPGDAFGSATAFGDFNGDGVADLAVSVPGSVAGQGRVIIYSGLVVDGDSGRIEYLLHSSIEGIRAWSLATGKFMCGYCKGDDLAIGHDGGSADEVGQVDIFPYEGGALDLSNPITISAGDDSDVSLPATVAPGWGRHTDAQFGFALATRGPAPDSGTVMDTLYVGVPGADAWASPTAPVAPPADWPGAYQRTGIVLKFQGTTPQEQAEGAEEFQLLDAFDPYQAGWEGGSHSGARFGHSIALAFDPAFPAVGHGFVLIGAPQDYAITPLGIPGRFETLGDHLAPHDVQRTGSVTVFQWGYPELRLDGKEEGSEFGTSLAIDGDRAFVGAPGSAADTGWDALGIGPGSVFAFDDFPEAIAGTAWMKLPDFRLLLSDFAGICQTAGERFGETLAIGSFATESGSEVLAVGAPSKNRSCSAAIAPEEGEGEVYVYDLNAFLPAPLAQINSGSAATTASDRFGASLALRPLNEVPMETANMPDGQFGLAIGVPGATHSFGTTLAGKISFHLGLWGSDPPPPGLSVGLNLWAYELEQAP